MTSGSGNPFGFLSRRRFLKLGLGGGIALTGVAGGLWARRGCAPDADGLKVLSDGQYQTLSAIARAQLPRGGPFPEGADDFDLARRFDAYLADEPPAIVRDLELALFLVEMGPVFFDLRVTTFSNLPEDEQLEHWQSWLFSDLAFRRQVGLAFKKFLSFVFFAQRDVWPHIGYPGLAFDY